MIALTFFVEGKPVPKGRPRLGAGGHTYTPARTREWENAVSIAALGAALGREPWPAGEPLRARIEVRLAGYAAAARARGDLDNYIKAVLDAMNGVIYADDAQVVVIYASKHVCEKGDRPGVLVTVESLLSEALA